MGDTVKGMSAVSALAVEPIDECYGCAAPFPDEALVWLGLAGMEGEAGVQICRDCWERIGRERGWLVGGEEKVVGG